METEFQTLTGVEKAWKVLFVHDSSDKVMLNVLTSASLDFKTIRVQLALILYDDENSCFCYVHV